MGGRPKAVLGTSVGDVFQLIRTGRADTRSDIGRLTGLSRTAVNARVEHLASVRLVAERAAESSTGGRPPARLELDVAGGIVLAAALGASRAQVAICDLAGRVLREAELAVDLTHGPDEVLDTAVKHLDHLLTETRRSETDVLGVGISVPGAVDPATGRSVAPPVQPGWGDIDIAGHFTRRFPAPTRVDNDVNVLALAEHRLHPELADLLVIKASTGIGAGVVAGGRLQRGALGAAGEIGHTPVTGGPGVSCRCGGVDCLETVAGGAALAGHLTAMGKPVTDALGVATLAISGDPDAQGLIRQAGRHIGEVIAGAVNLLNPGLIVIGGDLAHAYDPLAAGIRELVYQRAAAMSTRALRIERSLMHDQAGVASCASMILDEVLAPDAVDAMLSTAIPRDHR